MTKLINILTANDSLVEIGELVTPELNVEHWETPDDVHHYLGSLLRSNWAPVGQRAWEKVVEYMDNRERPLADFDKSRTESAAVLIESTGLYVSGRITAESEKVCRERKERTRRDYHTISDIHVVGTIEYSVGNEDDALHATTRYAVQRGSGHPGHFRGVSLCGTLPSEYPHDDTPPYHLTRVRAVADFIQQNFVKL